jgi:Antibiotic biosynthesis monooxygenase.
MIVRTWRGWTRAADAAEYERYLLRTGFAEYRATPGNAGVYLTRRDQGDRVEFLLISLWESWDAVRAFAGDDPGQAVFYPEDDRFLVDRETTVEHYEVFADA